MCILRRIAVALGLLLFGSVAQGFQIVCLNVGHGDCTLIRGDDGETLLIDAGGGVGLDSAFRNLLYFELGSAKLGEVIASRYTHQSLGHLDEAIRTFNPDRVWDRGGEWDDAAFESYREAAGNRRRTLEPGGVVELNGKTRVRCIVADGRLADGETVPTSDEDDRSLGLLVEHGDFRFFIAGGLGGGGLGSVDLESRIAPLVGEVDVLLVGRHGSAASSNSTLLEALRPKIAVVSVGANPNGLPHHEALDRLASTESVEAILQTNPGSGGSHPRVRSANGHIRFTLHEADGMEILRASSSTHAFPPVEVPLRVLPLPPWGDLDGNGRQDAVDLSIFLSTATVPDLFRFSLDWHRGEALPPRPTRTPVPSPTPTFTPSFTPTETRTFTPTETFTETPTFTEAPPTDTPTLTPTSTPSPTPTPTPSLTATRTPTETPSPTTTDTHTPEPTATFTPTDTPTAPPTPTETPTPILTDPGEAVIRIESAIPNPEGADGTGREEIVLVNLGEHAVDLAGWFIRDIGGSSRALSGVIDGNSTFVFNPSGNILNNGGDEFWLENPEGVAVHTVSYTGAQAGDGVRIFFD